jgi:hypothetical protein
VQLEINEIREAVELLGDTGGAEARIVAQLVLDLAISARFNSENGPIAKDVVRKLLHLRIARHRAANHPGSQTVH